ncbi:alkaline serine protease alp1 [Colletotrichum asianum]|uniref:Alkaline serine protease alp1 n=1 Tax=Colletotrichum asianum TaxID=702518 RepID=A0A8H3W3Z0_9PEZI|nr:alkaline serine protease alp1 [Colletotrichum asianum]
MAHIKRIALLLRLSLPAFPIPLASDASANNIVPDKYIVRVAPNTVDVDFEHHLQWVEAVHARSLMRRNTAGVEKTFEFGGFRAYAGEFDHETLEQIKQDKNVVTVEENRVAEVTAVKTQVDAPWGLATLSSPAPLVDGNNAGYPYHFDSAAGEGSFAYVMDTGVTVAHAEFEGRAFKGYNAWAATGETFDDEFGHGSHVAGTIGSATFGVAKKSTIFDVKVARGIGYTTTAHMLDGYSWVVNNITNTPGRIAKAVINISIAVPKNEAINAAVDAAFDLGVTTIVAAANDGKDAGAKSPASAAKAITVGAVAWNVTRADWSNFGPDVDIFAPGLDILSLWKTSGSTATISGTSMASPHVAGLVAYLRSVYELPDAATVREKLTELGLKGVVGDAREGSVNLLAHNGVVAD